jgi:hypothetical protein
MAVPMSAEAVLSEESAKNGQGNSIGDEADNAKTLNQ